MTGWHLLSPSIGNLSQLLWLFRDNWEGHCTISQLPQYLWVHLDESYRLVYVQFKCSPTSSSSISGMSSLCWTSSVVCGAWDSWVSITSHPSHHSPDSFQVVFGLLHPNLAWSDSIPQFYVRVLLPSFCCTWICLGAPCSSLQASFQLLLVWLDHSSAWRR